MKKIIVLSLLILVTGCVNPLYKPSEQLSKTILEEYKLLVQTDSSFTSEQKERRIKAVNNYQKMLLEYKNIEGK